MQTVREAHSESGGAQVAKTPHEWASSLALRMHTMMFKQAPTGAPVWGGKATTIQGLDRGTIRLLRRPPLAPPFAAVKKIPKRCDLLCVMIGGGGSSA